MGRYPVIFTNNFEFQKTSVLIICDMNSNTVLLLRQTDRMVDEVGKQNLRSGNIRP